MKLPLVGSTNGKCTWPESRWPRSSKIFELILFALIWVSPLTVWALDTETVELVRALKKAGLNDEAVVEIIRLEKEGPRSAVGVMEIPRADGKRDIFYYSVSTPLEKKVEIEKRGFEYRRSWDLPWEIIIDQRR